MDPAPASCGGCQGPGPEAQPKASSSTCAGADAGGPPPEKRRRVAEAPGKWAQLPAERLSFCLGTRDASTAVGLINRAARCPALTAYDLRWRRHTGQSPGAVGVDVEVRSPLLDNRNDPPVPRWPGLCVDLTEMQRRSLRWMLAKEAGSQDELVVERGCRDCRFSTHRGIDFQLRLSFTLRGGVLADDMGYGKTLLAIALTAASVSEPLPERNGRPPCSATLVFVPENLACQWLGEFAKALGDVVETVLFGSGAATRSADPDAAPQEEPATERSPSPRRSPSPTTQRQPGAAELSGVGEFPAPRRAQVFAAVSVEGWQEMMQADWAGALAVIVPYSLLDSVEPWFCLHRYHWRRVVVDELHEALANQTLADALGLISAQHVWGLSGTLPVATTGEVAHLAALFGVSIPIDATNAGRFLDCYVRKNSASATETIPMDEHCHVVRPTPMERAIYLACRHDFDQPIVVPEAHESYVPAFLSTWRGLQEHGREAALVKLCCHHQATTTDIELLSTPAQSVARLRVWKRHHCEEARRLIRRHAALAEWMRRGCQAPQQGATPAGLAPGALGQPGPGGASEAAPAPSSSSSALGLALPAPPVGGSVSDREAWECGAAEARWAASLDAEALLKACERDLEVIPFAVCERPAEAEARWLEWCAEAGLAPGTRGAISRLRKIMYDELWGRLVDGKDGWEALGRMTGRAWREDYAAAQRSRLLEAILDFASSLRSARFLEAAISQAAAASPGEMECGICLQALRAPRITPCAHIFCAACIGRSLDLAAQCPQCRAVVRGPGQLSEFNTTEAAEPLLGRATAASSSSSSSSSAPAACDPGTSKGGDSAAAGPGSDSVGGFGSKIAALVTRLKAIQRMGEKAVVFAQWQDLIFKIHAALHHFGVPAAVLAGGAFDRAAVLQRFEGPELAALLLSLEDSASGTNMSHANHVLLVHPMVAGSAEEQRAFEAQAVGRVRRWGQTRRVQVWRFVTEGTIEADYAAQRIVASAEFAAEHPQRAAETTPSPERSEAPASPSGPAGATSAMEATP